MKSCCGRAGNLLRCIVYKNGKRSQYQRTLGWISLFWSKQDTHTHTQHNATHTCILKRKAAESRTLRSAGRRHNETVRVANEPTDQIHYLLMQSTWMIGKQLGLLCIFARSTQSEERTSLRSTSSPVSSERIWWPSTPRGQRHPLNGPLCSPDCINTAVRWISQF